MCALRIVHQTCLKSEIWNLNTNENTKPVQTCLKSEIWNLNTNENTKPVQTLKRPPLREGPNIKMYTGQIGAIAATGRAHYHVKLHFLMSIFIHHWLWHVVSDYYMTVKPIKQKKKEPQSGDWMRLVSPMETFKNVSCLTFKYYTRYITMRVIRWEHLSSLIKPPFVWCRVRDLDWPILTISVDIVPFIKWTAKILWSQADFILYGQS